MKLYEPQAVQCEQLLTYQLLKVCMKQSETSSSLKGNNVRLSIRLLTPMPETGPGRDTGCG